jgi:hypothetical protein
MHSRFIAAFLLLAALAAVPAAAQVEGRFNVTAINGQALPTRSPTQRHVTIIRATYWFEEGNANMSMMTDASDYVSAQRAGGPYVIAGDSLLVMGETGTDTMARFRWEQDGDGLRLYDGRQNVLQLVREPVVASEPWRPGTWNAVQLNGHALPAPAPHNSDVTVLDMRYAFDADGNIIMRIRSTYEGRERTHQNTTSYRVQGDRLSFFDAEGEVAEGFVWTLRNGMLRLVDLYGHRYVFEPATATAP